VTAVMGHRSRHQEAVYWPDEMPGGGGVRRSVLLVADASVARVARVFAVAVLADWRLSGLTDDVCWCVSELASNAHLHADRDPMAGRGGHRRLIRLTMHFDGHPDGRLSGGCLRVQVRDGDPRGPVLRLRGAGAVLESGHGLRIVDGLSDGWSWRRLGIGKLVECWWFTTDRPGVWT
jgi:hypothetical protein